MNQPARPEIPQAEFEASQRRWQQAFDASPGAGKRVVNRSGIEVQPLYAPAGAGADYLAQQGFPGEYPYTRGIYASMHRGRSWTQRQLIGLGVPEDYNSRLQEILAQGATAVSLIPCNSVYRGYDADEVPPELLGTCGTVINSVDDMDRALANVPLERVSCAMNDPSPFTLLAFMLGVARRRGVPWDRITGTSNQSDCLSHFVANHMFFRIALPGARRIFVDHVAYCGEQVPHWNPVSVVGQHMQQAGATPAEAMAFTLCSAIQYADDCVARGMDPDTFLPRFTFFFDISMSLFEEVAKFRAGRRLWAKIARERFGAKDPRSWRFKFHGQTSGVDLTRQQPLNNIARVTTQAIAGILGGLQSLHTDSFDEVLSVPTAEGARIAVATQNILREEGRLTDVIDPLGGSYYVEALTDQMQQQIEAIIARVDAAGGMGKAVEAGLVQRMIGESAFAFQQRVESGEQTIVGVNAFQVEENADDYPGQAYPERSRIDAQIARLKAFKAGRSQRAATQALDALARAAQSATDNVFAGVVDAAGAGATHGEICACLRRELGFGQPLAVV
ncbi:MAG: acyl-CoA mutase large subunit family protein [Ramlibacter sp.]|nr:acyl-CoA mutase large subunit family protein [Ramlibacter sp.]